MDFQNPVSSFQPLCREVIARDGRWRCLHPRTVLEPGILTHASSVVGALVFRVLTQLPSHSRPCCRRLRYPAQRWYEHPAGSLLQLPFCLLLLCGAGLWHPGWKSFLCQLDFCTGWRNVLVYCSGWYGKCAVVYDWLLNRRDRAQVRTVAFSSLIHWFLCGCEFALVGNGLWGLVFLILRVPEVEPRSSVLAANSLSRWAILPAPILFLITASLRSLSHTTWFAGLRCNNLGPERQLRH